MKKLEELDDFKKFAILKREKGLKAKKLCKQANDQKLYKQDGTQLLLYVEQKVILKHLLSLF